MKNASKLRKINFKGIYIDDKLLCKICRNLENKKIIEIDFSNNQISDSGFDFIQRLLQFNRYIKKIILKRNLIQNINTRIIKQEY